MKQDIADFFRFLLESERHKGPLSVLSDGCHTKLSEIGFPNKKQEAFGYFPFHRFSEFYTSITEGSRPLAPRKSSELPLFSECDDCVIVCRDGVFSPELSRLGSLPLKVSILPLSKAISGLYGPLLRKRWEERIGGEIDPFALLEGSRIKEGLCIHVPAGIKMTTPLRIVFLQTDSATIYSGASVYVFAGPGSESSFIVSQPEGNISNTVFDVVLEENSVLSYKSAVFDSSDSFGFCSVRASVKRGARFEAVSCLHDTLCRREDYSICLQGEEASAEVSGLSLMTKSCQSHIGVRMKHLAPNCRSKQLFKQILSGSSKAAFTGKIEVAPIAQKTEAYQLTRTLLLSDGAKMYAKPGLEIFADDVKASHGATVAGLDEEQQLYLRSRGVAKQDAAKLLIEGFAGEVLEKIGSESVCRFFSRASRLLSEEEV